MLFKPADAVCLPSLLEGLSIEEPLIETIPDEVLAAVGRDLRQWEHFYTVKSDLVSGWVIGGSASGRQDQKSYSARTMFDGWVPGDEVIRLFEVNVSWRSNPRHILHRRRAGAAPSRPSVSRKLP